MSDKKGLSYEQRKAMYEQNIRDTDGKRHIDKLRDDTHNSNANNNGSKKNDPSKRHRAERIQLTPPVRETIPEQKAEPAPEKRIRKEKKHKSGRFKKWWKNIPAAPVMEYVPNAKRGRFDMPLFTVVIILLVMGIIMMSSASYAYALQEEGNSFAYALINCFYCLDCCSLNSGMSNHIRVSKVDYDYIIFFRFDGIY